MPAFDVLEPAIDPNNRITFLLDWELTMKCNLDCSYCISDLYGGHNNSIDHPPLAECLKSIDFMFAYADLYMKHKPKGLRYVVLNIYGGEALHHPDVVEILLQVRNKHKSYQDNWHLTIATTTNAIVSPKKLTNIIPYIDEFTVSYHSECSDKQKQQFKNNLLQIQASGRRLKCVVLMNNNESHFDDGKTMIKWLETNSIKLLPRQLDDPTNSFRNYNEKQIVWFNNLYRAKTHGVADKIVPQQPLTNLGDTGRACCGGRQMCQDQNYKERKFYVIDNKFENWFCSVNWFFLYVKQVTKEIFVNKDCKMNFDGSVGPIGTLEHDQQLLDTLSKQLDTKTLPVIQCKKYNCLCGLCAPKARDLDTYKQIIKKYQSET